jgi:TfoX/Sxy family transcriptional regulator of competence genes
LANESLDELVVVLEAAAQGLGGVSKKRMFGCDGLFAGSNIFGLVWKHGRIGVRLPNEIAYAEAMKMPGSSPWVAGTMTMSHWVLLPDALHTDGARLGAWVRRAHALASSAPKKAGAARSDAPKVVAKRPAAAPAKVVAAPKKATKAPARPPAKKPSVKKASVKKASVKKTASATPKKPAAKKAAGKGQSKRK